MNRYLLTFKYRAVPMPRACTTSGRTSVDASIASDSSEREYIQMPPMMPSPMRSESLSKRSSESGAVLICMSFTMVGAVSRIKSGVEGSWRKVIAVERDCKYG